MASDDGYWAQLVSLTDIESSPILIKNNKFVFGRNEDCDLAFDGNKLVSGKHCRVEKDDDGVWLYDTSTNGTLLNMKTKISKGMRHKLEHGDEIYIVYKKNDPDLNIGYMFQENAMLESDLGSDSTQDYTFEGDKTLSDDAVNVLDISKADEVKESSDLKRKAEDKKLDLNEKKLKIDLEKTEDKTKAPQSEDIEAAKASTSKEGTDTDDMLITLSCIICQSILHDCISLQPCLHTFCSGCYSEWMEKSNQCPSCRMKVDRINKNHLVNNMVTAYLKHNPGLKRTDSDLKELDDKNKITRDMLYPDIKQIQSSYDGSRASDPSDEYSDENSDDEDPPTSPLGGGRFLFQPFLPQPIRPNVPRCRQCPNYQPNYALFGVAPGFNPPPLPLPPVDPNDEDAKVFPTAPDYKCQMNGNHVLCLCCYENMPDRRNQYRDGGTLPPQSCHLCLRSYCHAYWGCRAAHCNGCISKLKDMNFGKNSLNLLILDNLFESRVFKDYITSKDLSVRGLLAECLAKMVTGDWRCNNQDKLTYGINTPVCYGCGFKMFKDLAYNYRLEISNNDLPAHVTRRPDCYWGKNCNTQRNKPLHAEKFNHICEQTRTA